MVLFSPFAGLQDTDMSDRWEVYGLHTIRADEFYGALADRITTTGIIGGADIEGDLVDIFRAVLFPECLEDRQKSLLNRVEIERIRSLFGFSGSKSLVPWSRRERHF